MSESSYSTIDEVPKIPYDKGDVISGNGKTYELGEMKGYGSFAKVMSSKCGDKTHALKIYFDEDGMTREVAYMTRMSSPYVLNVIDFFKIKETNTNILVVPLMESDLFEFIHSFTWKNETTRPTLNIVKSISRQLLKATDAMGDSGIVHTDMKPENILINTVGKEVEIKVADFGSSVLLGQKPRKYGHTSEYRSPEMILEKPLYSSSDVWATGTIIFELLTGDFMFSPKESQSFDDDSSEWSSSSSIDDILDSEHLALMAEMLGRFPRSITRKNKCFFNCKGNVKGNNNLEVIPISDVLTNEYNYSAGDSCRIEKFLMGLLKFTVSARVTAKAALSNVWLLEN